MFSDSNDDEFDCCRIRHGRSSKSPQRPLQSESGPHVAAELQILATVRQIAQQQQQMMLQQQVMAAQVGELHHMFQGQNATLRNTKSQIADMQVQLQSQIVTQAQIQVMLAENEERRRLEIQAVTPASVAATAFAVKAATVAEAALEEQKARAQELQMQLKKKQRPGARMRRRLRGLESAGGETTGMELSKHEQEGVEEDTEYQQEDYDCDAFADACGKFSPSGVSSGHIAEQCLMFTDIGNDCSKLAAKLEAIKEADANDFHPEKFLQMLTIVSTPPDGSDTSTPTVIGSNRDCMRMPSLE